MPSYHARLAELPSFPLTAFGSSLDQGSRGYKVSQTPLVPYIVHRILSRRGPFVTKLTQNAAVVLMSLSSPPDRYMSAPSHEPPESSDGPATLYERNPCRR